MVKFILGKLSQNSCVFMHLKIYAKSSFAYTTRRWAQIERN